VSDRSTPLRNNLQRDRDEPDQVGDRPSQDRDERPILFVDVDGVISLFGFDPAKEPPGRFHTIDGILHCIGHDSGTRLKRLLDRFEPVWATGWEERANEYMPFFLKLPGEWPVLTFDGRAKFGTAHWKLDAIDEYAGDRPVAWIDDSLDHHCAEWARAREAPTLLLLADSAVGIDDWHVERLLEWADGLERGRATSAKIEQP
jgi:hypothetical protein